MSKFVDLGSRLIFSLFSGLLLALLIYFSANPFVQFVIFFLVCVLAIVAIWEYVFMLKTKGIELPFWLLATLAVVFIFASYLSISHLSVSVVTGMAIAAAFFAIFLYHFAKIEGALIHIPTCLFAAFYILVPLGLILRILYPISISSVFIDGRVWIAYLLVITKITDVGAYFAGKMWGTVKLAPSLSPKKTMAGAIAGLASAIAASVIFFMISQWTPANVFHLTLVQALVLGSLIGVFGQLGDLAESLLKRDANIKDSNKIPGIGGALDLLDSLLFTAPIVYLFLRTMPQ